ncbi:hypothetical protein AB3S75_035535 [Citrus x aurantiifolia]
MHNAYFSSTLVSFKSRGSLSFSFNDYSSLLNERFDRTSLSCCSCCCTCCCCCEVSAAHNNRVPVNASYLCGLRQSTLIQRPPYKRLIFGFKDRIFSRLPVYDLDRGSCEVSCSIRERSGDEGFGRRRNRRFRRMALEETNERSWLGGVGDAEAVISLLSEEVGDECLGGTERNGRLAKRVEIVKNEVHGGELYRGRKKKKNVGSNLLESNSKCEFESPRIEAREEGYGRYEGREAVARGNKHRERTKSSSCSSYYSLSSAGEYEEVQDKEEQIVEESVSGFTKDSSRSKEDSYKAQVVEEFNEVDGHRAAEQRSSAAGSRVKWDCRKKSEKKPTEVATEETKSTKQSSDIHWRIDGTTKTDYEKASTSHQQLDNVEEESALAVNLDKGTRKLYSQMDVQDTKQSRRQWQEVKTVEEMHGNNVETTSESQKQFSGREENVTRGKLRQTGLVAGNIDLKRDFQQLTRTSEILNANSERVSNLQRHSESRMKVQQKDETLVQSSVQRTKGQHQQSSERITGQIDLRIEPEYSSELSETHDTNIKKSSTIQSETRMKNLEENSRLQHSQKDYEHHQRIQPWKGSQDVSRVSVIQASEMERRTDSLRTSEKGVNQASAMTSVVKPMGATRDRHNQPDEKAMQSKLRKEAQKPTGVSSSHEEYSEESSSIQASLNLVSQGRVPQINVEEDEEERISQEILMPPPPQLLTISSGHAASSSGLAVQEVSSESGSSALHTHSGMRTPSLHSDSYVKGGQDETYDEPLNLSTCEDALGSAHRFAESSTQLVGEFVEKARHEVSTSEMQKENIAETELLYGGEKQFKKNSGQYGSEDLHLKGREPRKSSESSGAKGPSDEMWHVTDSFVQPQAEAMEGNQAAGNAIVKRRGRSLWNIMADIVRLRWGSHAETPSSAATSDAKSPSNDSVSSGTWFSGHESNKNGDENMKREGSSPPQDATPFHQLQQGRTSTRSQGETSDKIKSKNKEQKPEAEMPSSSTVIEGWSTSKRISRLSSSSAEKNLDQKAERSSSQSTSSGQEVLPLSSQLPAETLPTPPAVEAVSETGSGSDGELKQRKLQRNKQVSKDRFDEWEEAYKLESEQRKIDEMFMREALLEAKKAADTWEVPVGAVLVQHGKIIARGCNLVEELRDSTAHAEMICIRAASNVLRTWRLVDATLYVTLEPCPMCAGAILQARVSTLVWGAPNKLLGADGSWVRLFPDGGEKRDGSEPSDKPAGPVHPFHPKMTIRRGVLAAECADIMHQFFQLRRRKKEKIADDLPPPSCVPIVNQQSKILTKMRHMFHMMFCL